MSAGEARRGVSLHHLCAGIDGARLPASDVAVTGITDDSRDIEAGGLFIAVPGAAADGADHAGDAVARGAAAVVAERRLDLDVPTVLVPDARTALAGIAAAFFGSPADRLSLVGITGTVGKTTVMTMLGRILEEADLPAGTIGSLGISFPGHRDTTPNTTPGALTLQRTFARMVDAGARVAAMEVTSHALAQQRARGVHYDVGVFTNLVMLEHMEYHGSFRGYADVKLKFLDMLKPDAPLIYASGDRAVSQQVRRHSGPRISCGGGGAWVSVRRHAMTLSGTRMTLTLRRPIPVVTGGCIEPMDLPLELRSLGRPNMVNAALAATTALTLGVAPGHVQTALATFQPPSRRMQVLRSKEPVIIDDTVGHPDSITAVFEVASLIPHSALRVAYVIRGQRGPEINARDAEAVAIWARRVPITQLLITPAIDTADERNEVTDAEQAAFLSALESAGLAHTVHRRLDDTIAHILADAQASDLVLLLGAQGMDAGADLVRDSLH